ncbi:MAG: addiction module protein [Saprospiraceae bacterium]
MSLDALKIEVLKLRKLQRLELMTFLLERIAEEEKQQEALFELTETQQTEVMRRREELKSGKVVGIDHLDVEDKIRKKHGF